MIRVMLLNGQELIINAELIEAIESAHDTIVTLTTGRKITVQDSSEELVDKVIAYRRFVNVSYGRS